MADARIDANQIDSILGFSVAAAGDVNGDSFDDIIVGALLSGIVASNLTDASVRLQSHQSEAVRRLNRYELDVAGLGDVNNDGFADVALGLGFFDAGELNEGAVFVYYGGLSRSDEVNVQIEPAAALPPTIDTYTAASAAITIGESVSLSWTTAGASSVSISGVGTGLVADGSITITLAATTTYTLTATGAGGVTSSSVTVTVNPAPPPSPSSAQGVVTVVGPLSVNRGQQASFTVTLTNTGTTTMTGVELTYGISPNRRIRNISPGSPIAVADIPAGGSVSQVWQGQADKEGLATATAAAWFGGNLVDSSTHTFTVTR